MPKDAAGVRAGSYRHAMKHLKLQAGPRGRRESREKNVGLWCSEEFPSQMAEGRRVEEKILSQCRKYAYGQRDLFALKLALEEAICNAIRHGNKSTPSKHVRVKYRITRARIDVMVEDEGSGFDPAVLPDPTADQNLERACGRGVLLMRAYMNNVVFNAAGNSVTLTKFNENYSSSDAPICSTTVAFG